MQKHIFLVLAHKNIDLLKQLTNILHRYNGSVIVHFDAKSSIDYRNTFKDEIESGSVVFLENNIKVYWGSSSIIKATFLLVDYALQNFKRADYYHLLSEQCFPIKSPEQFDQYFKDNYSSNFITCHKLPWKGHWGKLGGLDRVHYYSFNDYFNSKSSSLKDIIWKRFNTACKKIQIVTGFKRKYKGLPELYGGSAWWSLSGDCIAHLNEAYKNNTGLKKRFRFTTLPDEILMQTLIKSSPFCDSVVNNNLRYIDWFNTMQKGPKLLNIQDHWKLLQHEEYLFARKLNPSDNSLVEKLIKEVLNLNNT